MSATASEPKSIKMPHCGELLIDKDRISGWFHPIRLSLWSRIIGFHTAISKAHKAESVSYHRWNSKNSCYDTIIPYQVTESPGLSVSTDWQDPRNQKLLDEYGAKHGRDFFPACTIHTHVDASAFESGTDAHDEADWPGWHITLGHLLTHENYDLHCRIRLPKIPAVRELTAVNMAYPIEAKYLFPEGTPATAITQRPNYNDKWKEYISRVSLRKERAQWAITGKNASAS